MKYAEVDANGYRVLAVWQFEGKDYAYLYRRANGNEGVSFALNELVVKPDYDKVVDVFLGGFNEPPVAVVGLRDYFAYGVMSVMLNRTNRHPSDIANESYVMADAMMAARLKD